MEIDTKKTRHSVRKEGTVTLTVAINTDLKEAIRTLAAANGRVFSDYVRMILRTYVAEQVGDTGEAADFAKKVAEAKRLLKQDQAKLRMLK